MYHGGLVISLVSISLVLMTTPSSLANDGSGMGIFSAPMITNGPQDTTVTYGQSITLTCFIMSDCNVTITWNTTSMIDNLPEPITQTNDDGDYNTSITLTEVTLDYEGDYSCVAVSDAGMDVHTVTITVEVFNSPPITPVGDILVYTEGDNVTLTCTGDIQINNDRYQWTLPDGTLVPGNPAVADDGLDLTLTNISRTQSGVYICTGRITGNDDTVESNVTLNVQFPLPKVTVTPLSVVQDYNQTITLICEVQSTVDTTIQWTTTATNSVLSQPVTMSSILGVNNSTLVLTQITLDNAGDYTCTATNTVDNRSTSVTITVNVTIPAPEVTVAPGNTDVLPGTTASISFNCTIISFSMVNVTWTTTAIDSIITQPSLISAESEFGIYTSVLTLDEVLPSNGGMYTCTAVNDAGMNNDTGILTVTIESPVVNVSTVEPVVMYNDTIVLVCNIVSFDPIGPIVWTVPNDEAFTQVDANDGVSVYNSTLTIEYATIDNRGLYSCYTSNGAGNGSDVQDISVITPPPTINPIPDQEVTVGYNVTFECIAAGINLTYEWTFEPELINCFEPSNCILGESDSTLTILNIPTHFTTNVTCTVTDVDNVTESQTSSLIVNGLELVQQTTGGVPLTRTENNTVIFNCIFIHPTDILESISIDWTVIGILVNQSNTSVYVVNTTRGDGEIFTTLTILSLDSFVDQSVPQSPFRRVYNCEGVVGERIGEKVKGVGILVDVEFTPYFITNTPTHPQDPTRINLGESLEVSCYAIGHPTSQTSYEDVTDGTAIRLFGPVESNGQVKYTINVTRVTSLVYRCVAMNALGTRIRQFAVIIQDRPDQINASTVVTTFLSFTTLRLEWTAPFDNLNQIQKYNISYSEYLTIANIMTTVESPVNYIDITNLGINKNYSVTIAANNGVGPSVPSDMVLFRSINNRDISLVNVSLPRVLITNTSFYIQWSYPTLFSNPIKIETPPATIKFILLTLNSATENDHFFSYEQDSNQYADQYVTINVLLPATKYTVSINVFYEEPSDQLYQGEETIFEIKTLSANNDPGVPLGVDMGSLQGETPMLTVTWSPLSIEDGAEYLSEYLVRITVTQLPQVNRNKRDIQQDSTSIEMTVAGTDTSLQYPAEPFTQYTPQVFAVLDINGVTNTLPITSPVTVESGESVPATTPRNLTVTETSFTSVSLSWLIPITPNGYINSYTVYQTDSNGNTITATTDTTSYTSSSVTGGSTYTYRVTANTSVGEGPSAVVLDVTTPSGVYPVGTLSIAKGSGRTLIVNIPKFSNAHGPLSHYFIVIATGDTPLVNITTIYRFSSPLWRDLGYYATAVETADNDNITYTIGDSIYTNYNSIDYFNAPLNEDTQYRVFIRLYSSADNPNVSYRDSSITLSIEFPSSFPIAAVVVPIVIIIIVMILIIVIVLLVILFLRKTPKHTETFYLDEIKSTVKPLHMDSVSPPRNGTNRNNIELRGLTSVHPPSLSVQNSEVFTSVGQPTILLCEINGTPMPEVLWSRDGETLQGHEYKILADGSLYIMDTDLKDDGRYIVSAFNDGGTVEESVRVVVIAPLPPEPDSAHPPQTVSEFIERMALLHSSMDEQLEQEYHDVDLDWNITVYNAKLPVNNNKNRYVNIVPYDHSRVVLGLQEFASGTDYINASYVDGYNEPNAYIATQGPIPATFSDFWRMLWEFDIPTIIMVTNLKEDDKIKCHQYWPSYGASNYGDLQVTLKEVENIVDYSIRTFQIQSVQGGVAKEIRQFHFQVWPDHGVPQYATALLGFRKRIRNYHPLQRGPMAVHCSAGVGRTGTFIAIDTMMRMIEIEGKIDIFNFVRHMRFRRNYMVQTSTQYEFIHEALLETIMCGDTSLPVKSLNTKLIELDFVDPASGKSGFLTQFQTLESSSPSDDEFDCSVAQLPDNLAKTRCSKHLPPNDSRVVLSTDKYDSDYICASFIDGYRQRQCFITTQGPMKNTAGDFWRMVWEYNTSAIVMLTQIEESGIEQCVKYWPDNEQEIWGSFVVNRCEDERILPDYTVRKFAIRHIDNSEVQRIVTQFHYTNWPHDICPKNAASLNDMISEVLRLQRKSGNNPIAVHCSDGLGRTGTFCGAFTILERVKAEQVVDVFSTVKSLRIQQPGLLGSLDQYEFIHKIVVEFLTTFDNYDNFK